MHSEVNQGWGGSSRHVGLCQDIRAVNLFLLALVVTTWNNHWLHGEMRETNTEGLDYQSARFADPCPTWSCQFTPTSVAELSAHILHAKMAEQLLCTCIAQYTKLICQDEVTLMHMWSSKHRPGMPRWSTPMSMHSIDLAFQDETTFMHICSSALRPRMPRWSNFYGHAQFRAHT